MTSPLDAWRFSRIVSGVHVNGEIDAMSGVFKTMATHLESLPQADRGVALSTMAVAMADGPEFMQTVFDADPLAPEPVIQPTGKRRPAHLGDISMVNGAGRFVWPNWIVRAHFTLLSSNPKVGKTRFALELAKRIWEGREWPDGQKS